MTPPTQSGPDPSPWREAFIGLGSNLGDRENNLSLALRGLARHSEIRVLAESRIYETEPEGVIDQPRFLNQAVAVATRLSPEALMVVLLEMEKTQGRVRGRRWGPRLIDLDLLLYAGEQRDLPGLRLPHPRMEERGFVVIPLLEILSMSAWNRPEWTPLRQHLSSLRFSPGRVWPWPSVSSPH